MMGPLRSALMARFYDAAMGRVESLGLGTWRSELLAGIGGEILEIGAGTGVNLAYYPQDVQRLVLAEPDPWMRRELRKSLAAAGRGELVAAGVEDGAFEPESFDAVVSTLVLCSVADLDASLKEIVRLLRPGGRLYFIEHVLADGQPVVATWQRLLTPLWRFCCGNCHLTRHTAAAIAAAGLTFETFNVDAMRGAPAVVRQTIRGVARKVSGSC